MSRRPLIKKTIAAVKKAIEIISSDKVKGTLTSTSQSGLRKPHLLYPSFQLHAWHEWSAACKKSTPRSLTADAEIDQLEASIAKLTEDITELTNAWR